MSEFQNRNCMEYPLLFANLSQVNILFNKNHVSELSMYYCLFIRYTPWILPELAYIRLTAVNVRSAFTFHSNFIYGDVLPNLTR